MIGESMSDVLDPSSGLDPDGNPLSPECNSGSNEPDGKGRTLENVRGELVRKHDKLAEQIASLQDGIGKLSEAILNRQQAPVSPQAPPTVSPYGAPSPVLAGYTDEQLQQALASGALSPYQRQVIEGLIQDRRLERKTSELFAQKQREGDLTRARSESEANAKQAFPALRDGNSEFSKRVSTELKKQRDQFGEFPTDAFDVANRIARQMGVEVSRTARGFSGAPEGNNASVPDAPALGLDDDELKRIAEKLQYAMPLKRDAQGRMVRKKFNLENIKERNKRYDENSQFYRGKKIGGK